MEKLIVWAKPNCVSGDKVCELLADNNVPFFRHDPEDGLLQSIGVTQLPHVWEGDHSIGGYSQVRQWIENHG